MEPKPPTTVHLSRRGPSSYEATNARGVRLPIGGEDGFSPVELLLAAVAGCSAVDVDVMTSRRAEPESFAVTASGRKVREGGNHLEDVEVVFRLRFPEGDAGDQARARIAPAVRASAERDCTVSRTVELPTPVTFTID
ncbi:OsmC family protein [Propioniciclava soli]|uniref:OsmC family protein n=1 Tax=Propioniciclava soli TaxID=2775081 RepID=A0ABZ3C580_9ACTN|nr:OsmC family protein [Propioniciclava soli]